MAEWWARRLTRGLAALAVAARCAGAQDPNVAPSPSPTPLITATPRQHAQVETALHRIVSVTFTDAPLADALRAIAVNAGIRILFSDRVVPSDRRITAVLTGVTVERALVVVLDGTDIVSRADGDQITLSHRDHAVGQGAALVHGRVTDTTSTKPVEGAVVTVEGLPFRVNTNSEGFYVMPGVPSGRHMLVVHALGYRPASRVVDVPDSLGVRADFALSLGLAKLAEVVTTATGPRRRLELGNDVTVLDVDSIVKTTPVSNLADVLTARVPGLSVMPTSGNPGDPVRLRLHGINSIQLNSDPVIIVDGVRVYAAQSDNRNRNSAVTMADFVSPGSGVELQSPTLTGSASDPSLLDQIDVNSIESLEVVKGPAAATLYGPDAAAGVIVITTKHGSNGPARWTIDASEDLTAIPGKYPTQQLAFGHLYNSNLSTVCPNNFQQVSGVSCVVDSIARFELLNNRATTMLSTGVARRAGLSVSGGSTSTSYNVGATVRDNTDMLKLPDLLRADYERARGNAPPSWLAHPGDYSQYSVDAGFRMYPSTKFGISITAQLASNDQNRASLEDQLPTYMRTYQDRGTHLLYTTTGNGLFPDDALLTGVYTQETTGQTSFVSGAVLDWRPFPWLANTATVGLNLLSVSDKAFLANGLDPFDSAGGYAAATKTTLLRTVRLGSGLTNIKLVAGWKVTLSVGAEYTSGQTHDLSASSRGGIAPGVSSFAGAQQIETEEARTGPATYGVYVDGALGWRDRLFIDPGIRLDAGNSYGQRAQQTRFPKINVSYLVNQEPFFPAALRRFVDLLQLRGAYGESGQQPLVGERFRTYGLGSAFLDSSLVAVANLSTLGNTRLRPERGSQTEAGASADLFGSRLSVGFNWSRTMRYDALLDVPVPPSAATYFAAGQTKNIGVIRNLSIDVTVGALVFDTPLLGLRGDVSLSRLSERVMSLAHGVREIDMGNHQIIAPGYPLFGIWAQPILGYADRNHDGIIEPGEVVVGDTAVFMGGTLPNYDAGFHVSLDFFRHAMSVNAGFHYENGLTQTNLANAFGQALLPALNDPHAPLGEQAAVAALSQTIYGIVQTVNTFRFDNLSVWFPLPQWTVKRIGAHTGSLGFEATNLLLVTNYHGKDPDVNSFTYGNALADFGQIPTARTYGLRLQLTY